MLGAVAERVDVDLDRVLEEPVDESRPLDARECLAHLVGVVADAHRAAAEHVRRADEHRVADPVGDVDRLRAATCDPPLRAADAELGEQLAEALAILGEVDGIERRAENAEPRGLDRTGELERRLAAELDHDAVRLLPLADREHRRGVERLEVEAVARVVVGRHRLRVAVDHDRLVAERAVGLHGVHAAVVELDALADAVRAGAEDDDALLVAGRRRLVLLAPGRVVVVRRRLDLAGARVDAAIDGRLDRLPRLLGAERLQLALEPRVQPVGVPVEVDLRARASP